MVAWLGVTATEIGVMNEFEAQSKEIGNGYRK